MVWGNINYQLLLKGGFVMHTFLKKASVLLLILYIAAPIFGQYVGDDAPEFTIMQYEGKTFDTDTVYNKKVVTFVFGSIT